MFHLLLRVAVSGIVGVAWSAQPCKHYSVLKLRRPGPKALRTPQHMDGVPGLSAQEQRLVDESREIHVRARQILRAVHEAAGQTGMEQPPSAMSWLQEDNFVFLQEIAATCAHVPACAFGVDMHKTWAFCGSMPGLRALAGTCSHPKGSHESMAGKKDASGAWLSTLSAEYPPALAQAVAQIFQPYLTSTGKRRFCVSDFASLLPEPQVHRRPPACDGAGLQSTADHSNPDCSGRLDSLANAWLQYLTQHQLFLPIIQHLHDGIDSHPLPDEHQLALTQIAHATLHPQCAKDSCFDISPGQPFCLELLQAFAMCISDPDTALPDLLRQGVPTGIFEPIPSSMLWPQRQPALQDDDLDDLHLLHCAGNWTRAEKNPALLDELIQKEISNGWVKEFPGSLADAQRKWPARTAVGKLNVVLADGKDARLVLDSTACNVNPLCFVPEHVRLPTSADVACAFLHDDAYGQSVGLSLDFKAAHKCVQVRQDEQGCLLFQHAGKLFHYTVCHFGAKFSAYWWQRLGGMLLRIAHALLARYSHKAWLYVDDLLAVMAKQTFVEQTCLLVCLLACLHAPISWRKAQLGHSIDWCGWQYNLDFETVTLLPDKLAKLQQQLLEVARTTKTARKTLEKLLGLLMWATTTCPQLRPYMAPLYKDLRSKRGTLHSVHPNMWEHFLHALTPQAVVARSPAGLWLPLGGQVLQVAGANIASKSDIPRVPRAHQETWVRTQDPTRREIHLCKDSRVCLYWLHSRFSHARVVSLRQAPVLHCMAAADARADGDTVGIAVGSAPPANSVGLPSSGP